ncbi:hypothetical protein Y032_0096g2946 [Ancylostoma ceylanicum]|uniref:Uncharacterized protein n=1 Tax=Ancylostoma ceylanicum TaxID=53326 RepID=A0A016TKE9_9BILA|nr:hypothetical protein Y032_0096g2946 [Ancylostoma ceylanicum]
MLVYQSSRVGLISENCKLTPRCHLIFVAFLWLWLGPVAMAGCGWLAVFVRVHFDDDASATMNARLSVALDEQTI